jgi:hypothetical protein
LEFRVYQEEFVVDRNRKIFLSHKGVDKPVIREYFRVLQTLRFDPWLDEDAMVAGTPLERGILDGFDKSCAAVFFVTPNFQDENFLATEINYAMAQKRKKGDRFSIITIVFSDRKQKGKVPKLLEQYVWKEPKCQLEALDEIVRFTAGARGAGLEGAHQSRRTRRRIYPRWHLAGSRRGQRGNFFSSFLRCAPLACFRGCSSLRSQWPVTLEL